MKLLTAKKLFIKVTISLVILLAVCAACLFVGSKNISLNSIVHGNSHGAINSDYQILVQVRLPRIFLAVMVGAALACAGVVFQGLLRNPLADPYILGISSGAGLGAIIATISGITWTLWGRSPIAIFAFAAAMGTVWLVWMIGRTTGKKDVTGLLLAGVVVNSFFSAVIMFLTSIAKSDQVYSTIFWLMGNMSEEPFSVLWFSGGIILIGIAALFFISPQLNVLSFGRQDAKTIGIHIGSTQLIAFAAAAMITAVAVSLSGLIGFVGLIIPHSVRLIFGPDHRQLLPLSAIVGAIFLVAADTLGRVIVAPTQLPVGVVTAIVGGPFFIILLIKNAGRISWFTK